jgi:hypothetical protein
LKCTQCRSYRSKHCPIWTSPVQNHFVSTEHFSSSMSFSLLELPSEFLLNPISVSTQSRHNLDESREDEATAFWATSSCPPPTGSSTIHPTKDASALSQILQKLNKHPYRTFVQINASPIISPVGLLPQPPAGALTSQPHASPPQASASAR